MVCPQTVARGDAESPFLIPEGGRDEGLEAPSLTGVLLVEMAIRPAN